MDGFMYQSRPLALCRGRIVCTLVFAGSKLSYSMTVRKCVISATLVKGSIACSLDSSKHVPYRLQSQYERKTQAPLVWTKYHVSNSGVEPALLLGLSVSEELHHRVLALRQPI